MKLTKETLKRIIKEELDKVMDEQELDEGVFDFLRRKKADVPRNVKKALFNVLVGKGYADAKDSVDGVLATEVEPNSNDYKNFGKEGLLVRVRGEDVRIIDPKEPFEKGDKFYVGEY